MYKYFSIVPLIVPVYKSEVGMKVLPNPLLDKIKKRVPAGKFDYKVLAVNEAVDDEWLYEVFIDDSLSAAAKAKIQAKGVKILKLFAGDLLTNEDALLLLADISNEAWVDNNGRLEIVP